MVENADHDVRPLDLAELVNPATAPDVRPNDVAFDTRHMVQLQYDLLLC
jgi:hypothetical protein